jgi:hypothetical protein
VSYYPTAIRVDNIQHACNNTKTTIFGNFLGKYCLERPNPPADKNLVLIGATDYVLAIGEVRLLIQIFISHYAYNFSSFRRNGPLNARMA